MYWNALLGQAARDAHSVDSVWRESFAILVMTDLVDDHGAGEDEHVIFARRNFHTVSVGQREPFPRDSGDDAAVALERVFAVEKTAGCLQIVRTRHVDGEMAAEEVEQIVTTAASRPSR